MEVGDEREFPIEQRSSIVVLLQRMRTEQMRIGWDAEMTTDKEAFTVSVKRVR